MARNNVANNWCGYVDILGVRAIAIRSASELNAVLLKFHKTLDQHFSKLGDADMVAYSDGAYFSFKDLDRFIDFYKSIRNSLYDQSVFFNVAVMEGAMEIHDGCDGEEEAGNERFRSYIFTGIAPSVYQAQTALKGVGCDIRIKPDRRKVKGLISNFYVRPFGKSYTVSEFSDVPFGNQEMEAPVANAPAGQKRHLDNIYHACHLALSESPKFGAYYMSAIINSIRSSDTKKMSVDGNKIDGCPYPILKIISDKKIMASIADIAGHHLIYLATFDHIYQQHGGGIGPDLERAIVSKFTNVKRCFRNLTDVPTYVISADAKRRLMEVKSDIDNLRALGPAP